MKTYPCCLCGSLATVYWIIRKKWYCVECFSACWHAQYSQTTAAGVAQPPVDYGRTTP